AVSATTSNKARFTLSEAALRKEETARKCRNMIENKLKDDKAATINRLLKKPSRPNKCNTAAQSDEDIAMDKDDAASAPARAPTMQMYRWVSTSRNVGVAPSASISFSIPKSFLPPTDGEIVTPVKLSAVTSSRCAVEGCGGERKYRAVGKTWGIGACGLEHLKLLEARNVSL
ncbi:hypothetical protein B0H13DRAFT_1589350, partial [Mycena leptocephala]